MSNEEVRRCVLGADNCPLNDIISSPRLRWFGHVLHMATSHPPFRALFTPAGQDWKKRRVDVSHVLCLDPRDENCLWLETPRGVVQNQTR